MSIQKNEESTNKDCGLPGISFSGVLPQELEDDMLCCNNSMIIIITDVCITSFKSQFSHAAFKNVSCEMGNQRE